EMHNAVCVVGNHEVMAIDCLDLLCREIDEISIEALDKDTIGKLSDWIFNGGKTTIDGFRALSNDKRREMIEFIKDFEVYEEVEAGGKEFLLVHAGLGVLYRERISKNMILMISYGTGRNMIYVTLRTNMW
nr:hypothetical protein [Lachnospiraceae bacterium]